jgi:hypothetical protein
MKAKHWHLSDLQYPDAIHMCLTGIHAENVKFCDHFVKDLKEGIQELLNCPPPKKTGTAALYGETQSTPTEFMKEFVEDYLHVMGQTEPKLVQKKKNDLINVSLE